MIILMLTILIIYLIAWNSQDEKNREDAKASFARGEITKEHHHKIMNGEPTTPEGNLAQLVWFVIFGWIILLAFTG